MLLENKRKKRVTRNEVQDKGTKKSNTLSLYEFYQILLSMISNILLVSKEVIELDTESQ